MRKISVAVPGPWWTRLLYLHEESLTPGVRVLVPLGRSSRVGLVVESDGEDEDVSDAKLKPVSKVLDITPPLPLDLRKTLDWFAETWFIGAGTASKTLLPSSFFDTCELPAVSECGANNPAVPVKYVYEQCDTERFARYSDMAANARGGKIFLFPEPAAAKRFWNLLPDEIRNSGALWPASNPSKQWKLWQAAREGALNLIVGSQAAAFVPMRNLALIVMDDESSGGWRTQRYPYFHHRPLVAARSEYAGAQLVLGGRIPSSKAYMQAGDESAPCVSAGKRLIFVDLHDSSSFDVDAVRDSVMISRPLVRETKEALSDGNWAMWILDRKGYAGEIYCSECGLPVRCPRCGGVMRWEGRENRLACLECSATLPVPDKCPSCGGPFLEGVRPGLEALASRASRLFGRVREDIILLQNDGERVPSCKVLMKEHQKGGIIIGTRKILAMTDELPVRTVGWIDSDSEARQTEYDAKARAFSMIWESLWRGKNSDIRRIVVQSRRPEKGWQSGLSRGFARFWKNELKERKEWELPPFVPMLKVTMPHGTGGELSELLDRDGISYWESENSADEIWLRTKKFALVRKSLSPFFHIRNVRRGFPSVRLFLD